MRVLSLISNNGSVCSLSSCLSAPFVESVRLRNEIEREIEDDDEFGKLFNFICIKLCEYERNSG